MVADDGAATAAWEYDDSDGTIIQAARMSPSGAWSAPIDVTDASANRTDPSLAIDGPGNATAVFMARPDDFQIESASLDTTGPTVGSLGIPPGGIVGQAVSFFATASDLWSSVASYSWKFGDGASAEGPAPSHAYVAPGSYPVTVTVTDSAGNTTTRSATTTVTAAGAPPLQPPTKHAPEITVFKVKDTRIQGHRPSSGRRPGEDQAEGPTHRGCQAATRADLEAPPPGRRQAEVRQGHPHPSPARRPQQRHAQGPARHDQAAPRHLPDRRDGDQHDRQQ